MEPRHSGINSICDHCAVEVASPRLSPANGFAVDFDDTDLEDPDLAGAAAARPGERVRSSPAASSLTVAGCGCWLMPRSRSLIVRSGTSAAAESTCCRVSSLSFLSRLSSTAKAFMPLKPWSFRGSRAWKPPAPAGILTLTAIRAHGTESLRSLAIAGSRKWRLAVRSRIRRYIILTGTVLPLTCFALVQLLASSASATRFAPPPQIFSVSPSSGPSGGGTAVTITGYFCLNVSAVTFGSTNSLGFTEVHNNTIIVNSPAQAVGTVNVRVICPNGTTAIVPADQFTYVSSAATG